ncbi:putative ribonuclease H-like domain-containing protein [Tanacetum coccineum]|uniref:Ribonuclease H-like domain-containing protein n=1 Tax=Tanacetum coccineum TaxID=301880 RepID=A0ABQ5IHL8_9ASTR
MEDVLFMVLIRPYKFKIDDVSLKADTTVCLVLGWDKDSIKLKKAVFGFIEDVITKTIDYHLFDVVVEFHREIHDLNFRGSSCKNLFVLSSSNRGRLLGFTDLMRQKNKRMKQEGLIQHYGILEDLKSNSSNKDQLEDFEEFNGGSVTFGGSKGATYLDVARIESYQGLCTQPLGFVDPDHPNKVYRWSSFIWDCIKLIELFEALMKSRFQMSSIGELTFFLGLQVKQNKGGIFISQNKYVAEILKKFNLVNVKASITPMETKVPLIKDEEAIDVDVHLYRSMIGHSKDFTSQCYKENL